MVQTKTMADLVAELEAAMQEHREADLKEQSARSDMTRAINRLNAAHKAIDELYAATRKLAPWNTHWHSKINPGNPVSCE
jgi:hypothetical protein